MTEKRKEPLVVLTGPTAVGKTKLSIALAKAIGGEIISADSMQVYRRMDIGSAKIRPEEMEGIPHYLIDVLEPTEEFHVVRFQQILEAFFLWLVSLTAKYQARSWQALHSWRSSVLAPLI